MPDLKNKVAIITGSSSGIGAATAEYFAKLGASLAITGRNANNLDDTRKKCLAAGLNENQILSIQADVSKRDDLQKLVDETVKHFGKLDILINAAGILTSGSVAQGDMKDYEQMMNVNVRSLVELSQLAVPHLIKTKGSIVNVSSIAGPCAFSGVAFYCMSKAAVDQLTKCLALELADKGVRVNAVNPGVIITDIHKRGGMSEADYAKFLEHGKTTHAMGRVGEAIEVAKCIAFLASDDSSFVTGDLLRIDGGRGIMTPR
jgi:NAD(P)-dependent dehydrogenase (short-subunit alcohol dehydrogenase family)